MKTDVLILGGGIAGAALSFNLRRKGYAGKILIMERERAGSNIGYGYRNTFREVIESYDLPFVRVYSGLRDGVISKGGLFWCDVDAPLYFYDYSAACESLLARSDVELHVDTAVDIDEKASILQGSKGPVEYRVMVDCTGYRAWSRARLGLPIPEKYYVGRTFRVPKARSASLPDIYTEDRIIWYFESGGYTEEIYALGDELLGGIWDFSKSPEKRLEVRNDGLLAKFGFNPLLDPGKMTPVVLPSEPAFPMFFRNIAYLGDSCGQATPSSSEGTRPILEASEVLAEVIVSGSDLSEYQRRWVRKNLLAYSLHKAFKDRIEEFNLFFERIRGYPDLYRDLILNKLPRFPMKVLFPSLPYLSNSLFRGIGEYFRYRRQIKEFKA